MRKYTLDETTFDNVDNEEKAWALGLIISDGNVRYDRGKYPILRIELKENDKETLEHIKLLFKTNKPLYYMKARTDVRKSDGKIIYHSPKYMLAIHSQRIVKALEKYGVIPRKSLKEVFPDLPNNLIRSYVLGNWDGDGAIYNRSRNEQLHSWRVKLVGSYDIIHKTNVEIEKAVGIIGQISRHTETKRLHVLCLYGRRSLKVLNWLYDPLPKYYMERKYQKYLEMKKYYNEVDKKRAQKCLA
jgi:hypothetical protein